MKGNISADVHILTSRDLDAIKDEAFQRGVKRGAFEERCKRGGEKVAMNCANWSNGICDTCGVQWQGHEVSKMHKCKHFSARAHGITIESEGE